MKRFFAATAAAALIASGAAQAADHHNESGKEMAAEANIVETAKEAGTFNTLLAAAEAAGLAETLADGGPFTVFAPTDDAFAALPEGTVDELLLPENKDKLVEILQYHVVEGETMSDALAGTTTTVTALNGGELEIDGTGDGVTVNGAAVTTADVDASNGVIHVVDEVLMP